MPDDEELIRRTLAEYCQWLDDRQFEDWCNLFTEDATWANEHGRAAIRTNITNGALAKRPELKRKHVCSNLIIDVSGDRAHVDSDFVMLDSVAGEPWGVAGWGHYRDEMVKQGGRWLFQHREFVR